MRRRKNQEKISTVGERTLQILGCNAGKGLYGRLRESDAAGWINYSGRSNQGIWSPKISLIC